MLYRIPIYIMVGITMEVLFTALCDLIAPRFLCSWNTRGDQPITRNMPPWWIWRDARATGYTFLWMVPIYGSVVFLEPLIPKLQPLFWFFRGCIYTLLIFTVEFVAGWLIKTITGKCPWDYSYSRFSLTGTIRLDFAPLWFGFGLFIEWLYPKLVLLNPHLQKIF